jgi:hypothetical protein
MEQRRAPLSEKMRPAQLSARSMSTTPAPTVSPATHRLRFELIIGSVLLALGLFGVPAVVYLVGIKLLGPYGEGAGLGTFYVNFFADLASGTGRAWSLALGPLVAVSLVRLLFLKRPTLDEEGDEESAAPRQAAGPRTAANRRKEPSVNLD